MPRTYDEEVSASVVWYLLIGIATIALIIIGAFALGVFRPTLLTMERKSIQSSPEYVQSKQAALADLKANYLRLDIEAAKYGGNDQVVTGIHSQQKAVLNQMYQERSLIAEDAVPQDVRDFLRQHPQGG